MSLEPSRTPFFVTSAPRTPRCGHHKNSTQRHLPTTLSGARACCRPHFVAPLILPSPSNLPFPLSLPLFPDYRVTVAVTPPERSVAPRERRERVLLTKGVRGTRRPCRLHRRRNTGVRRARRLRRPRRCRVEGAKGACCSRCPRRRRAAGVLPFSPSPLPRPPQNAVTPVVMRPIIATNN